MSGPRAHGLLLGGALPGGSRRLLGALAICGAVGLAAAQDPGLRSRRLQTCRELAAFVAQQQRDKQVPAICIAVLDVDPQGAGEWSWATGVGSEDQGAERRAGAGTVFRAGSIGKLVTATAAMVLVEQGRLDLDAPVQRWLPQFAPGRPGGAAPDRAAGPPITLRLLLGHRSGLPRQSPVGHWYDDRSPGLQATVDSLGGVPLAAAPGDEFRYSNPGYAVAGRAIEVASGQRFEDAVMDLVLRPLGLGDSSFDARADLVARTARGQTTTLDGRAIPPVTFQLGCAPAANLRTTVLDLVQFARSWLPRPPARVLRPATQAAMWQPPDGAGSGCGLGFFVDGFAGARRVHHGGAISGYASEVQALPDAGLAVAVAATADFANALVEAIAERALAALFACRRGEALPAPDWPQPVGAASARALAGRYVRGDEWFDLRPRGDDLLFDPCIGVATIQRQRGAQLVSDDLMSLGDRVLTVQDDGAVHDGIAAFARAADVPPPAAPAELLPLLGEYGWDHAAIVVYEDDGRLGVLVDWHVRDLPVREGPDRYRFLPGVYGGELLQFERDGTGAVAAAVLGNVRMPRRPAPDPHGFRVARTGDLAALRRAAANAAPPAQPAGLRAPDLVDLRSLSPTLHFDIKYATADNFLGEPVYEHAAPRLQRPAAAALLAAEHALAARGFGLCIFDAYRPWSVTRLFWDATPPAQHQFVADPAQGSRHNRGCAVDLTLCDLATGAPVEMPSGYDEFTPRAYPDWPGGTAAQRWHRDLLRRAMTDAGFTVYEYEWWHFDFADWRQYPVLDEPLR